MANSFSCIHYIEEIRSELGGVVSAVVDLCQAMADRGHRIIVATCDARDAPSTWRDDVNCPQVLELSRSIFYKRLIGAKGLAQFAGEIERVDVAHLHTPWCIGNYQLASLLRRARIPYVVSVHGMLDRYCMQIKAVKKHAFLRLGGRRLFKHAATVHFTAEEEQSQALRYLPSVNRTAIEPCFVNLDPYDRLPGPELALRTFPQIAPDMRKILFLSRIHPKKGVDRLMRAFAMLAKAHAVQLLLAGPGDGPYLAQLKSLAKELKINDKTIFLGMVRDDAKLSLYQAADVFVLPTHQENFGLVLPEAMACGTPVVTTRGTDIWRELARGGAKIVDGDPPSIAAAVEDILLTPEVQESIRVKGRSFVRQWLDRDHISSEYELLYYDAMARKAPSSSRPDATQ